MPRPGMLSSSWAWEGEKKNENVKNSKKKKKLPKLRIFFFFCFFCFSQTGFLGQIVAATHDAHLAEAKVGPVLEIERGDLKKKKKGGSERDGLRFVVHLEMESFLSWFVGEFFCGDDEEGCQGKNEWKVYVKFLPRSWSFNKTAELRRGKAWGEKKKKRKKRADSPQPTRPHPFWKARQERQRQSCPSLRWWLQTRCPAGKGTPSARRLRRARQ